MSKVSTTLESLRDQPNEELQQALARTRDELFRLHLGQHTNQVTSSALLKSKRRDIARIMTILSGRKTGIETQAVKKATTEAAPAEPDKSKGRKAKAK